MAHGDLSHPLLKAVLCSCLVYVAPVSFYDFNARIWWSVLLSPKLNDSFGVAVWIAYLAWTVVLQGVLGVGLYFFFKRATRLIWMPIAAAALFVMSGVPLSMAAVWLDARVVPFVYRQSEGKPIAWEEYCRVDHAHLLAPAWSRYGFLEHSARAWIVFHATEEPTLLLAEGCQRIGYTTNEASENELRGIFKPEPGFIGWDHIGFRDAWFDRHLRSNQGKTWASEYGYQFTPKRLMFQRQYSPGGCAIFGLRPACKRDVPAESGAGCPELAGDADSLGFLGPATYSETERSVEIKPAGGTAAVEVDISKVGPGFISLEGVSVERRTLLLRRQSSRILNITIADLENHGFSHEYSEVSFDGQVLWRLPRTGDADDGRLVADSPNWIWWKSEPLRAPGCCLLEWNVGGRAGAHKVARGRKIVSVSLSPSGQLIAVSVSDRHRTGGIRDSVYVIRSRDNVEVFRGYLPPLTESRVQFLGSSLLAYTDFDGSDGFVRVVKVPDSADGTNPGS
jgi:hypothetical protein